MIERYLDYISFSRFQDETVLREQDAQPIPPVQYYTHGYRDALGTCIYFGNPNSKKAYFIMAGRALQYRRNAGIRDSETLEMELDDGAKISRLDLAVTEWIEDHFVTVEEVQQWYLQDLVVSPLVKYGGRLIEKSSNNGAKTSETFYIGDMKKRGRKGIFRVYDKGIDLDISKYLVTRLELELRGEKADNTAKRLAKENNIAGNFRAHFNVHADTFNRLMDADAVDSSRGKAKLHEETEQQWNRRWIWLLKQVAPALESAIEYDLKHGRGVQRARQFALKSGMYEKGLGDMVDKFTNPLDNSDND